MNDPNEQLESWLIGGVRKREVRHQTALPSSERLVSEDPGDGETAMETVASWLVTRPKLPIVELANLSPRTITLTFAEPTVLPDPWVNPLRDSREPSDQWGITLQHALNLTRGEGYGWQVSGLTGMGTLADQSRLLMNTTRWELLGLAGSPDWVKHLMTTQVMNQAAERWSNEHDIWLVGYQELGDKLMNFLSSYHPVQHFRTVDSLAQIPGDQLRSGFSTIYVMGASAETLRVFNDFDARGVGLVTDCIVSDKCMFLTQRESHSAVIGPFKTNLEVFPNYYPELIEAMESGWEANAQLAAARVAEADFSALFQNAEPNETVSKNVESDSDGHNLRETAAPINNTVEVSPQEAVTPSGPEPIDQLTQEDSEQAVPTGPANGIENSHQNEVQDSEVNDEVKTALPVLRLFGKVTYSGEKGELTGRNAEALALLMLSAKPLSSKEISEALWPGDESEGQNARTRRMRLKNKIREVAGEVIDSSDDMWRLDAEQIVTDLSIAQKMLQADNARADLIEMLETFEEPLKNASEWAKSHRQTLINEVRKILQTLLSEALDNDDFAVAKHAQSILKKTEER